MGLRYLLRTAIVGAIVAALFGVALKYDMEANLHHVDLKPSPLTYAFRFTRHLISVLAFQVFTADMVYVELATAKHVLDTATKNDPDSVLNAIDERGWAGYFMTTVADVKGAILDNAVQSKVERQPQNLLAVELGTFMGYSAVRIARFLPEGARLISVDPSALAFSVATVIVEHAGLRNRVQLRKDFSHSVFRQLAKEGERIDLLFLDHGPSLYLADVKEAMALGILSAGCVIVADNMILPPGASDYKEFVTTHECFNTTLHDAFVEYTTWLPDAVSVSTFRGGPGCFT